MTTRAVTLLIAMFVLAACQAGGSGAPPAVSLEEAKRITAEIKASAADPPPRSIRDIMEVLREPTGKDAARLKRYRAIADAKPPDTTDRIALWRFYRQRGKAADFLGRTKQTISDMSTALEHVLSTGRNDENAEGVHPLYEYRFLGITHHLIGDYERAVYFWEKEYERFPQKNRTGGRIVVNSLLAIGYGDLGRIEDADAAIGRARDLVPRTYEFNKKGAIWSSQIRSVASLGEGLALVARGNNKEAEPHLRKVIRDVAADMSATEAQADLSGGLSTLRENQIRIRLRAHNELAVALRREDRLLEAEIHAREAVQGYVREFGRYSGRTAIGVLALAETIMDQARFHEARLLAEEALELYDRLGAATDSYLVARAQRIAAASLAAERRWEEAAEAYLDLEAALAKRPRTSARILRGDLTWALAFILSGRVDKAAALLRRIHEERQGTLGAAHLETAEAGALLASAMVVKGEREEALRLFAATVPVLVDRSGGSDNADTVAGLRHQRTVFVLESYIRLLAETGDAAEAFRVAEVARSRAVQRALNASGARAALREPELADLARREQDAQKQVAALYGLLANNPTGAGSADLRARIGRLSAARVALMREIESRFPAYADLINPKPATVEDARAALHPGEALIATYSGEDRTYVWAVSDRGEVGFHAAPLGREALADRVAALRRALEPAVKTLGDIPAFDVRAAHDLYKTLLAPLEGTWKPARSLVVVAHGPLGYLPLSLLPTKPVTLGPEAGVLFSRYREVPWLVRSHAVTNVPSVAALRTLRGLPPAAPSREAFKGFGDSWFRAEHAREVEAAPEPGAEVRQRRVALRAAPQTRAMASADLASLPRLPDTADEVRRIAVTLKADPVRDVFLGKAASESRIKRMDLSRTKVLAFATHGLVPGDLDGLLQPALAFSAPSLTGGPDDGLLTMNEVLGLALDADWVVLSACNTGAADGAGAEAVSGLGRAFFYAGTRALLVSNWPVETTSATALTTGIFEQLAEAPEGSRTEALRRAMLALIDGPGRIEDGKTLYSYAHPLFWAPFSVIGEGGAASEGGA